MTNKLHLFQGFGIEIEYAIVDRKTLKVKPIVPELFYEINQEISSEVIKGEVTFSNELASHVLEIKVSQPAPSIPSVLPLFHHELADMNKLLKKMNACLMPTGAHPFCDPVHDTLLWPHEGKEIYEAYHQIFGCHRHGFLNLQSVHLNLPFYNDEEFEKLHAAIRVLLPIIPGLSASTPILEGRITGHVDTRLYHYQYNQKIVPSITGKVIPEAVFSKKDYEKHILEKIYQDMIPHDPTGMLRYEWLNSRGAIARFDRNTIEIRLIDTQESVLCDFAILDFLVVLIKALTSEQLGTLKKQKQFTQDRLALIFQAVIKDGLSTRIEDAGYLSLLGIPDKTCTLGDMYRYLFDKVKDQMSTEDFKMIIEKILTQGNLSERLLNHLSKAYFKKDALLTTYRTLCECLDKNTFFSAS